MAHQSFTAQYSNKQAMAQLANISILIVDEDTLIPSITRNILEKFGFKKIFHVKTAQAAIEALDNKKIDLIIS